MAVEKGGGDWWGVGLGRLHVGFETSRFVKLMFKHWERQTLGKREFFIFNDLAKRQ